ncbi:diaminopimelate epimerase, partial [Treponema sp.]|uniref:diaminopimelate epimerase n=1 Tax=Treponema sp. TaxID=166 RepID=UPI0025FD47A5
NICGIQTKHGKKTDNTETITIETESGIKSLLLYKQNGKVTSVTVDMGKPEFKPELLPTTLKSSAIDSKVFANCSDEEKSYLPKEAIINQDLKVEKTSYKVTALSVGNPHAVIFSKFVDKEALEYIGPLIEHHKCFPERTNTEFVRIVGPNEIKLRTWERSNGETLACGTGACAAAIASVLNGYCPVNQDITVEVKGGTLLVKYTGKTVYLTGNTIMCYEGEIEI